MRSEENQLWVVMGWALRYVFSGSHRLKEGLTSVHGFALIYTQWRRTPRFVIQTQNTLESDWILL